MPVSELIALFLRHAQAVNLYSPEALAERQRTLTRFSLAYGHLDVKACQAWHLSDWIEGNVKWRSTATRKAKANQVNAVFNWAVRQGRIDRNPFGGVGYPDAEPRPCMPDQVLEKFERLGNKQFELALRFLRLTGMRLGELCQLEWRDVDLKAGSAVIRNHKTRKHTKKAKVIALIDEAVSLLTVARAAAANEVALGVDAGIAGEADVLGHVFLNTQGRPWTRRTLGQQLRRLKLRHGLTERASLHGVRHTFGTEAVRNGAPLKLISLQMGHSSVSVTERYYLHLDREIDAIKAAAAFAVQRPA